MPSFHELSPEQQEVVLHFGQGMAVLAGAGSGKTTTLVVKCIELLKRNPKARFAAVSFTERSASDLRAKLSAQLEGGLERHWVTTIHGLCASILREFPREAGCDGEETVLSEGESALLWDRATESLWFEELPSEVQAAVESLLSRESRDGLLSLLSRVRALNSFGVLEHLKKSEDPASLSLAIVGEFVLERYGRLKRRRGALDFNDLEIGADRVLLNPKIRTHYRGRFDLLMVDEFQDTNPIQARILWNLAREDVSNLCVVGDPKQSIYRFRDADISVFEECCSRLPIRLSLTWNFRSRPGIIDFSNQVCAPIFEASGMAYEPLTPKREVDPALEPVVRLDCPDPKQLATWVRSELDRGVKLHEMALLLRKIRGSEKWLSALSTAGIPIAVGSGGLFWEDPRVREMVAFLKWWDNPANALSGAAFLRAPWVGIPDLELDAWVKQDPTWEKPFFASKHPLARKLAPLRPSVLRPGEVLLQLLEVPGVEAELGASLLGLWHRVEELSSRGLDFHGVVHELGVAIRGGRREREVPPPANEGQLSVLTLHGSKGLEFPHVILIDFPEKPVRSRETPLLFWDREKGVFLGKRDESGDRDRKDPDEKAWREDETAKNIAESKRLFYVALTRARERLILVHPESASSVSQSPSEPAEASPDKTDKIVPPESIRTRDDWRGWVEVSGAEVPTKKLAELKPPVPSSRAESKTHARTPSISRMPPMPLHRPRHSVTEWNTLARCPRAYEWGYVRKRLVAEGAEDLGLFTGEKVETFQETELTQRELGTRVHSCLERADFDGLKQLEREAGLDRFQADPVISWALSSPLMRPQDSAQGRKVWTELSFEVPISGQVLVGSMDRLVHMESPESTYESGDSGAMYTLLDFKVTAKAKSVETLLESYQHQMALYQHALERLEPKARGKIRVYLVNISSRAIQMVPVQPVGFQPEVLAQKAAAIVQGEEGVPQPGPLCRFCEFRTICDASGVAIPK